MINQWWVAFYRPRFRNHLGKIDPRVWLGHCEIYGCDNDSSWIFMDPKGEGLSARVVFKHQDVLDELAARHELADLILKAGPVQPFLLPLHMQMTCASVCGAVLGIRAWLPSTLRRKMLRNGAEVINEKSRGRLGRPSGADQGASDRNG